MASKRLLVIGNATRWSLEQSYARAFASLGFEIKLVDPYTELHGKARPGLLGRADQLIRRNLQTRARHTRVMRNLVMTGEDYRPDLILVSALEVVSAGALAQLKSVADCPVVMVWPDPMISLRDPVLHLLPLCDLVATYSRATVPFFEKLGAPFVEWIPLGADPDLYPIVDAPPGSPGADARGSVVFVGNHRPEREAVLDHVVRGLGAERVKIWGGGWKNASTAVKEAWRPSTVVAEDCAQVYGAAAISLNIMDRTNHTGANMRFFEVQCAGGLQLSSYCEEFAEIFRDGESIFYFDSPEDALTKCRQILEADGRQDVRERGVELVRNGHTYSHRAQAIRDHLTARGTLSP